MTSLSFSYYNSFLDSGARLGDMSAAVSSIQRTAKGLVTAALDWLGANATDAAIDDQLVPILCLLQSGSKVGRDVA